MNRRPTYTVTRTMTLRVVLTDDDVQEQEALGETDHDSVRIIADNTPASAWTMLDDEDITP